MMRYLFFILILNSAIAVFAQPGEQFRAPKYTLKWSPLHLISHYPTFQIAVEQRFSRTFSVQYDFGPVLDLNRYQGENDSVFFHKRGYKVKVEARHYFATFDHRHWVPYIAPEVYYNRVNYRKSETVGFNCENGLCDYYRFVTYDMRYREPGVSLKGGVVFRSYRFVLDFQAGLSARFIRYNATNKPMQNSYNGDEGNDEVIFFPVFDLINQLKTVEEDRNLISPTASIRIGYILE